MIVAATLLLGMVVPVEAHLQVLPDPQPQCVFGGGTRTLGVICNNDAKSVAEAEIGMRLLQVSSATMAPVGKIPWKKLRVLPEQTVLESARVDFPAVTAETEFLIQWLAETGDVLGETEVWVYPTNLLGGLKVLAGQGTWGVWDPNDELKPLLRQNGVVFIDLGAMSLDDFAGQLVIVGPFRSATQMREGLTRTLRRIARKGTAVVLLQPPPDSKAEIEPSFYALPEGKGAVMVVQPDLVADFSENPKSQLNLVYFCKQALNPQPLTLPGLAHDE